MKLKSKFYVYCLKVIQSFASNLKKTFDVTLIDINFAIFLELNSFYHREKSLNILIISLLFAVVTLVMEFVYIIKEIF